MAAGSPNRIAGAPTNRHPGRIEEQNHRIAGAPTNRCPGRTEEQNLSSGSESSSPWRWSRRSALPCGSTLRGNPQIDNLRSPEYAWARLCLPATCRPQSRRPFKPPPPRTQLQRPRLHPTRRYSCRPLLTRPFKPSPPRTQLQRPRLHPTRRQWCRPQSRRPSNQSPRRTQRQHPRLHPTR